MIFYQNIVQYKSFISSSNVILFKELACKRLVMPVA